MKVIEIFGPTIQGEGPCAGRACHFLRFGGCDFRCSWCDTMYAVEPAQVRAAEDLAVGEIVERLLALPRAPMLVISGGNPALQRAGDLVAELFGVYDVIGVETQGSVWRDWLWRVDSLVTSPKAPSSGMASTAHERQFLGFMDKARPHPGLVLKIVIFDAVDLDWAISVHRAFHEIPLYLSAGTDQDAEDPLRTLSARYAWLCESVVREPELHDAVVLPQLHVVAWGNRVGV